MALDKWQKREARQLADNEGLTEAEAQRRLFPEGAGPAEVAAEAEAEPDTPEPEKTMEKAPAAKR